jgi:hypothetical protein
MLRGHQGGHIVHGEGIDQGLIGLGVIPFIVDEGNLLDVAHELLDPLSDRGEGVRKLRGIDLIPTATFIFDLRSASPYASPAYPIYSKETAYVTSLSDRRGRLCHSHV